MGVVLRARDTVLNRPVAVKLLSDEIAHIPEAHEIFLTEGRALADLSHPNLVRVFDVIDEGPKAMMVLEYVDGINLDDRYRQEGRLTQEMAVDCGLQLCDALTYLHENGYIHRDLKPANVMVQPDGTIKLIDFGLARSLDVIWERGTRVRGSPAYMAPEQVTGERLSFATDVYALGTTLFELLSGNVPFLQGDMSFAQVHREPPRLAERVEGLHPSLYGLIDQCLRKRPEERPSTRAVSDALRQISEDVRMGRVPEHAAELALGTAPTMDRIEVQLPKKSWAPKVLLATLVVVGVGVGAVLWSQQDSSSQQEVTIPVPPVPPVVVAEDVVELEAINAVEPATKLLNLALSIGATASEAAAPVSDTNQDVVQNPRVVRRTNPVSAPVEEPQPDSEPEPTLAPLSQAQVVVEEKPVEEKPVEEKPAEVKPAEVKPAEVTPVITKKVEAKPVETKKVEVKPVETKPVEKKKPAAPLSF
jgi:serine/threonine-protein kinase